MRLVVIRSLAVGLALALAGCAAGRNDGWSKNMNTAVVNHYRSVNGVASK